MNNKRLFLSLSDSDVQKLDSLRAELGMNRSEYIRFLLSGQRKKIPFSIKEKRLIEELSKIDLHLRDLCLRQELAANDVLFISESLKDLKRLINDYFTCGPADHKLERGDKNGKE